MKIVEPSFEFLDDIDGEKIIKKLERIGRTCYQSFDKTGDYTAEKFIAGIIKRGHESVIEHVSVSVSVICDRGVSHEIVRHRLASYSQESTRYCNYDGEKYGSEITVIKPCFFEDGTDSYTTWLNDCMCAENNYLFMVTHGCKPEEARTVLPNSLKTEICITMNLREWRHFFKLRTAPAAHPQMREIATKMLKEFQEKIPVIFDDIEVD